MTGTMSSPFTRTKVNQSHLYLENFFHFPDRSNIVSIENISARMKAEGGSPTESQGARPEFVQEVSHVLAKTSTIGEPMELIPLLQEREIRNI